MSGTRSALIWGGALTAMALPVALAATSPLLAWREGAYILGGFAGIVALSLLLVQPLLPAGLLPGVSPRRARHVHKILGASLLTLVALHVGGLWLTSPPDVIDVLLWRSPTPFGIWGAISLWAITATGLLALLRPRIPPRHWRLAHATLGALTVLATSLHAILIQGAMEPISKAILCGLVCLATLWAFHRRGLWPRVARK